MYRFFVIPWTGAHQAPVSMWFSRQESWSGLLCPSLQGILDIPGIKPRSSALQTNSVAVIDAMGLFRACPLLGFDYYVGKE